MLLRWRRASPFFEGLHLCGLFSIKHMLSQSEIKWIKSRSAGILLHITSLPGPAYTGDIGPCAKSFADFLRRTKQKVWQMLPLNPTGADQGFSPYSSSSAMAANPLLISPDWLVDKKLLDKRDIKKGGGSSHADFKQASEYKNALLQKAWEKVTRIDEDEKFRSFNASESYWLDDYAIYTALKKAFNQSPWFVWPAEFRDRNKQSLDQFVIDHKNEIQKTKWVQMIFHQQWQELRTYCNELAIQLMGDMPMYVAHDSADVWSNRNIFTLTADGALSEVSGVPPDIFNDDGQLWGTPLFKWDVLKESGYTWWVDRFKRNMELFDMLRIDHFRGFSDYWAVPADKKTAKDGQWKQGPRTDLFYSVKQALGDIALIAEDLGDIDEPVYALRDGLHLPGMNVLQFAFTNDAVDNNYLPHHHTKNSVVYPGTHDNNTNIGWFSKLARTAKKHLFDYTSRKITSKNVSDELCRLAYQSVGILAVLSMQDVLCLDESSRMNMPATSVGNWTWRLERYMLTKDIEKKLDNWVTLYGR